MTFKKNICAVIFFIIFIGLTGCSFIYKNSIFNITNTGYIYTVLGFAISVYTLMKIDGIADSLKNEKLNNILETSKEKIQKTIKFMEKNPDLTIEKQPIGDSDGDSKKDDFIEVKLEIQRCITLLISHKFLSEKNDQLKDNIFNSLNKVDFKNCRKDLWCLYQHLSDIDIKRKDEIFINKK